MSSYADIRARIEVVQADAEATKATVLDAVRDLRLQLEHLTGLITTGDVPEDVMAALDQIDATIRAIDPNDSSTLPPPGPVPVPEPAQEQAAETGPAPEPLRSSEADSRPAVQLTPEVSSIVISDE